jgi:hypothetical protein
MRNDARPIGEDAHNQSPIDDRQNADERDSVTHDRQSHIINKDAEDDARPNEGSESDER